jgi:hypothetical protein
MREFISMLRKEPEARLLVVYTILWFVFVMFIPVPITEFLNLPYSLQRLFIVAISGAFGYLLYKHFNKKLNDWDRLERLKHYKHIELEKTKWTKGMLEALPNYPDETDALKKNGEHISNEDFSKSIELAQKKIKKSKSYFEPQIPLFDWRDIEDFFDWNGLPAATFSPIEGGINGWFVNESGVWKEASPIEIVTTGKVISKGKFKENFLEIIINSRPFDWDEVTEFYWTNDYSWLDEMPVVIVEKQDSTKAFKLSPILGEVWEETDLNDIISKAEKYTETAFFKKLRVYERLSSSDYDERASSDEHKNAKVLKAINEVNKIGRKNK